MRVKSEGSRSEIQIYFPAVKCSSCHRRKGKRECPALNGLICTPCCGEKRVSEIHCPSDCRYLSSGRQYQTDKKYIAIIRETPEPSKRARILEALRDPHEFLLTLEQSVRAFSMGFSSLKDHNVRSAYELVQSTYQTENKGIIYEHKSSDPLVQPLVRQLRADLEAHRNRLLAEGERLDLQEILNCLELSILDVSHHISRNPEGTEYLDFIRRNVPDEQENPDDSGIIIPG